MSDIKEFLRREDIQQLLQEENLDEIYRLSAYESHYSASDLTTFFIDNKINFINYITRIYPFMFEFVDINVFEIPSNIIEICEYGFSNCEKLERLKINNSVTKIGFDAFLDCINLNTIHLPKKCEIKSSAFYNCPALKDVYYDGDIVDVTINIKDYSHDNYALWDARWHYNG